MTLSQWKIYDEKCLYRVKQHIEERGEDSIANEYDLESQFIVQHVTELKIKTGHVIEKHDDGYWYLKLPDDSYLMNTLDGKTPYVDQYPLSFIHIPPLIELEIYEELPREVFLKE